ncbi:uncharacterized protein LOC122092242 [Macadamia integrifolia]|uniref:uncharacterized protein LOC122092242 n=1 Tax=Macadamia integrifolia TaxID=60698 RepID=UPI001C4F6117|nr:uncharacterized protein LOC122092242 [Macadamia integrifolia]
MREEEERLETGPEFFAPAGGRPPDRSKQMLITDFWSLVSNHGYASVEDPRESMPKEIRPKEGAAMGGQRPGGDVEGRRSYAAVSKKGLPDVDDLPEPIRAGPLTKVVVPQEAYEEKLQTFSFSLIGRVNFSFISMDDIRRDLAKLWNLKGKINLAPLGKGFILFRFEREGDMSSVWRRGPIKVGTQVIRFQKWRPEFSIHDNHTQTKLVWVRFPELPMEYWHEKILLTMAKAAGRPVALDRKTLNGTMGNYARVLVEVELVGARVEEIQVERKKPGTDIVFWFKQRVLYEDDLSRCTLCKKLGHMANQCRDKKDERKPVDQNNGSSLADVHVQGNFAGVGREGSTAKTASPSCVRSPRLVGEYFSPTVMETVNGEINCLVEGNLVVDLDKDSISNDGIILSQNLGGPNSNKNHCRENLEPNMVDNPLGEGEYGSDHINTVSDGECDSVEGSEQGEDDANPRAGNNLEESFAAWNLRPRRNINYHGGHAGRGSTKGGRGGRGEEGVVAENIVKGLPPTQLVGGRAIVHHPEVAAIDNALRAKEAAARKGLKKASGKNALRVLVKEKDPDMLCIAEPMIEAPNLWVVWKRNLNIPTIIAESEQHISVSITWDSITAQISFVHVSSFRAERRSLWMKLMADSPQSPTPWVIMGDFNATLQSHEKRGPGNFSMGSAAEFGAMVDACLMAQVPSSGLKFTWSNNRRRGNVRAVLDRSFCNDEWISRFQDCAQTVFDRIASDHAPIMVTSALSQRPPNAPFRFHKFWIDHTDFETVVNSSWSEWISGNPIFVLMLKLKKLKEVLKIWAKTSFPNIDRALEDA